MTAVCLYLPEIDTKCKTLTLEIIPFIKEKSLLNTKDNMPENLDKQLKKFQIFLNFILYLCHNIKELKILNILPFNKIINFFKKEKIITLNYNNRIWEYKYNNNKISYIEIKDTIPDSINDSINKDNIDIITIFNNNDSINIYNGISKPNSNQINFFSEKCEILASNYNKQK